MKPRSDEELATLASELAKLYIGQNELDEPTGMVSFDAALVQIVGQAIEYAFRVGYRARVTEETAPEPS